MKNLPPDSGREMKFTRRAFLRVALLTGIGAGAYIVNENTRAVGFERYMRWLSRGAGARFFAPNARVALAACPAYDSDVLARLREA